MTQIESALKYFVANYEVLISIWQGLLVALSTLCALVGWTKASKILGTFAVVDGGRLVRYAKQALDIRKAIGSLIVFGLVLGCSGQPLPQPPVVCPIPSQYLAALPTPAAVASATQAAQGAVEQVKEAAEDPTAAGVVLAAQKALAAVAPLCGETSSDACQGAVAQAQEVLESGEARRKEICQVIAILFAVVPVEQIPAELVAAQEICR